MYDFHVHSDFSMDCKYTMEEMVEEAINKHLKCICFTDHVEFEVTDKKIDMAFRASDYFKNIKQLKYRYVKDIEILGGVEIGIQPHLNKRYDEFIKSNPFDYVLMSLHSVNGMDVFYEDFYIEKKPLNVVSEYFTDLYRCLDNFDSFDVVGHLDLIDRYCSKFIVLPKPEEYEWLLTKILEKIIMMGKGIELNTSGIRYGLKYFHPKIEILKLYKKLGGEIITIGSDSHQPEYIGFQYKEAEKLLKELGYKYIFIFRERKKIPIKIS